MTNWKYQYDVNKHVRDGETEQFKEIAKKIFNDLKDKPGLQTPEAEEILDRFLEVDDVEEFDGVLDDLYNYADENKIGGN